MQVEGHREHGSAKEADVEVGYLQCQSQLIPKCPPSTLLSVFTIIPSGQRDT